MKEKSEDEKVEEILTYLRQKGLKVCMDAEREIERSHIAVEKAYNEISDSRFKTRKMIDEVKRELSFMTIDKIEQVTAKIDLATRLFKKENDRLDMSLREILEELR